MLFQFGINPSAISVLQKVDIVICKKQPIETQVDEPE